MDFMVKKRIAIILARGGSKRLPRKNLIDFGGKPLLEWSVAAALESNEFDKVLVSTDDEEIAQIAINCGADVPFLRLEAADDITPSSEATCVALLQAEEYWQTKFDIVAQLMANCPLRTAQDVRNSISAFDLNTAPSQISCFRFGWMNPWWSVRLQHDGKPLHLFPEALKTRSQDLPPLYCPTGALWIAERNALIGSRNFYMEGHCFEPIDWLSAVDIDDQDDLLMAKICLGMRNSNKK
jgi:CMP-N-acetylneuraminic acid synthetase